MKSLQWILVSLGLFSGAAVACAQAQTGSGTATPSAGGILRGTGATGVLTLQTTVGGVPQGVKGAPYSADVVHVTDRVLADGNRIHTESHARVFRDSEGRTRNENEWSMGGVKRLRVIILDPIEQINIILDPEAKTANVHHFNFPKPSADRMVQQRAPGTIQVSPGPKSTLTTEDLGTKDWEGLTVTGRRDRQTFDAGSIDNEKALTTVTEHWTSPTLHVPVFTSRDDPRTGLTTMRLTNIQLGEPDPLLFQVPSDYTVKEPH